MKALVLSDINITFLTCFIYIVFLFIYIFAVMAIIIPCSLGVYWKHCSWVPSLLGSCALLDKRCAWDLASSEQPATENLISVAEGHLHFGHSLEFCTFWGSHLFLWRENLNVFKLLFEIVLDPNQLICTS